MAIKGPNYSDQAYHEGPSAYYNPDAPSAAPTEIQVSVAVTVNEGSPEGTPFPEAHTGPVSGSNGLYRLRYFDGRMLTADGMRKEQRYWDARARMPAEVSGQGVVWGLGLQLPRHRIPGIEQPISSGVGSIPLHATAVLRPGLAFDGAGRPIAVGADFAFTFQALLTAATDKPKTARFQGPAFGPCVCLTREEAEVSEGGAPKNGAYLLVIEPEEAPEGEAKVYGTACRSHVPAWCAADGWRGGFGLSLAALDVEVPVGSVQTVWDLRGSLAAWYFDVRERRLAQRWQDFPKDGDALTAPGGEPTASAVPIALVYLQDGAVLFVDCWIPRRVIASTAPAARAAAGRGAPTDSQMQARLAQFQTTLAESLAGEGMEGSEDPDLYSRGFRHIPPYGFLPITPKRSDGGLLSDAYVALQQAREYFKGTNVVVAERIALQDDEILGRAQAARALDPVQLRQGVPRPQGGTEVGTLLDHTDLAAFAPQLQAQGTTLEQLANHEVELVWLVTPLRGLRRRFAALDAPTDRHPSVLPHDFVFYVRQPAAWSVFVGRVEEPAEPEPLELELQEPEDGSEMQVGDTVSIDYAPKGGVAPYKHTVWAFFSDSKGSTSKILASGTSQTHLEWEIPADIGSSVTIKVTTTDSNPLKASQVSAKATFSVIQPQVFVMKPEAEDGVRLGRNSILWKVSEGWTPTKFDLDAQITTQVPSSGGFGTEPKTVVYSIVKGLEFTEGEQIFTHIWEIYSTAMGSLYNAVVVIRVTGTDGVRQAAGLSDPLKFIATTAFVSKGE